MNIKNLKLYKPATSTLISLAMIVGSITASAIYYNVETTTQVKETAETKTPVFTTSDGKTYGYFDIGEHIITVSRNDVYPYKTEEIEGYAIKSVEINSYRDNNKITYVNTVPVFVEVTKTKDDNYEFNTFGTVEQQNTDKTSKSK